MTRAPGGEKPPHHDSGEGGSGALRKRVVYFAVALSLVTYIDRVAMSQAAPFVAREFALTKIEVGWIFSAFALAYSLFEIPGGWMSDHFGPRPVLLRIVSWWSLFTAATGWAWNYGSILAVRFLFGAGEAGCYPALTRLFQTWLPADQRARAQGYMWLSSRWAGALTPVLALALIRLVSWRFAFQVFALAGMLWVLAFWLGYRPAGGQAAASQTARHVSWAVFFRRPTVLLLFAQYFAVSWGWSFYITWLPTYVLEGRGAGEALASLLSTLPLFFGGFGCVAGGLLIPVLARRWTRAAARGALGAAGCLAAGLLLVISLRMTDARAALVVIALASFSNDLALAPAWDACSDTGGRWTGSLSGAMNMAGNFAGFLAPATIGHLLTWSGQNWAWPFSISAVFYLLGCLAWLGIKARGERDYLTEL
ncbi:MAG: MFS transporter [Acidobacteria bacterium]|nr:MFS transporter [Acidobacteriota bacterium]